MISRSRLCRSRHEYAFTFKGRHRHNAGMKSPILSCAMVLTLSFSALSALYAARATWNLNPTSGYWNTATNWTPATVPNGPADVATFAVSNQTAVSLSADTTLDSIVFNPGASAFTISVIEPPATLTIDGVGIVNNSGVVQNFLGDSHSYQTAGLVAFTGTASAGSQSVFTANGSSSVGAFIAFSDSASAVPLLLSPTAASLALPVTSHF
jgi:hypothetical protein